MNQKKKIFSTLLFLFFFTVIVACSNNVDKQQQEEKADLNTETAEPVTIKILYRDGEEAFNQRFKVLEENLENIIIEPIIANASSLEDLQELNANNVVPDIINAVEVGLGGLKHLKELDMIEPLDDLIAQMDFDLDRINPAIIKNIRALDHSGKIIGLPTNARHYALFYNKEIFDLFGEEYPEEQLTWEEVLELATRLTGERNGQQYIGLELGGSSKSEDTLAPLLEFGINLTDPETGEVLITEEPAVKRYFELLERLYSTPDLYDPDSEGHQFATDTVAMITSWVNFPRWGIPEAEFMEKVGVSPIPIWEEHQEAPLPMGTSMLVINKYSEQKKEAFQVLKEFFTAEHQTMLAEEHSELPILTDADILEKVGSKSDKLKHLDLMPVFTVDFTDPPEFISIWDVHVDIQGNLAEFATLEDDVPTFLRKLKEKSEAAIEEYKSQLSE